MIIIDKKERRKNWPGIEFALRQYNRRYVSTKDKVAMRRYYIEGIEPKLTFRDSPNLLARLMCEPDATRKDWEKWKKENGNQLQNLKYKFMNLQNSEAYIGDNTPFNGRESEIYDFFFSDNDIPAEGSAYIDNYISEVIGSQFGRVIRYLGGIALPTHNLVGVHAFKLVETIRAQPKHPYIFYKKQDFQPLANVLCPIAWAYQNPKFFDQKIEEPIRQLHELFVDPNTNDVLRETFASVIDAKLKQYVEECAAGGVVSACIQYNSNSQLRAVLPLLTPSTRFPFSTDTPKGAVLPLAKGVVTESRAHRESFNAIWHLWRSGFVARRCIELDNNRLFVQFSAPILRQNVENALSALVCDLTNLEERINGKDTLNKDLRPRFAKCVYLVEPLVGRWMIGATTGRAEEGYSQLFQGDDNEIDRYFEQGQSPEVVLPELLESEYERFKKIDSNLVSQWRISVV